MKFTGKIRSISIKEGKAPYGYIIPNIRISGHEGEILFFGDKLIDINIEDLKIGDLVQFNTNEWRRRDGSREKVAVEVCLFQENIRLTPKPRPQSKIEDSNDVKGMKDKISSYLSNSLSISDAGEFEDYVFMILRLLGIHNLYQYDKKNQAGRADGFFIIGSLAVMYDCTLRQTFEDYKKEQIENYVNKLKNSQITIDVRLTDGGSKKKTLQIQGKNRQVWIITQSQSRELYDVDGIRVKEVSIKDIMKIFTKKLYSDTFEEEELSSSLTVIDKS
ncbi:hypothetical protein NIES21_55410 [Anabaenopsis circularis NIES-21]|uniref:Uncharacterized protein n=1 Tax=Anabaenopsis circularis NIES-21 TaxID=1085406 RepID=A0A1Z4GQS1_9CYAN|nr:hypothetical protein NIES21_55410 [Anabaenopsis circularis NIES-21]